MACEPREQIRDCRVHPGDAPPNRIALSAKLVRRMVIGHIGRMQAAGRKLAYDRIPLNAELAWVDAGALDLSLALDELEARDAEKARVLELRYFLGFTREETAAILDVAPSSVDQDLRFSLAWLNRRLDESASQRTRPACANGG